jgi:hypothetical protein
MRCESTRIQRIQMLPLLLLLLMANKKFKIYNGGDVSKYDDRMATYPYLGQVHSLSIRTVQKTRESDKQDDDPHHS